MTSRLGAIFWGLLVLISGFATFSVKYAVQNIEDEVNRVRKRTAAEVQEVRVLTAEWTYLNQPERLADLNRRFLGLTPIAAAQLQRRIEDIPLRPVAAPPPAPELPETTVAAAGEPEDATPAVAPDTAGLAALAQAVAAAPIAPTASAPLPPPATTVAASPVTTASAATMPAPTVPVATARATTPAAPVVQAVLRPAAAPAPRVQLAKAVVPAHRGPASLDALVAQIAEAR